MLFSESDKVSEETKKELAQARKEIKEGKYKTLQQVKNELGLE